MCDRSFDAALSVRCGQVDAVAMTQSPSSSPRLTAMNCSHTTVSIARGLQWLLLVGCTFGFTPKAFAQDEVYLQQIRVLASGGPEEFGRALHEAIRLRDWKVLESILATGSLSSFDDAGRRVVAQRVGSRMLSRAALEESLAVSAKSVIEDLSKVFVDANTDPAVLDAAVIALGSEDQNSRLKAGRTLLAGGTAGLSKLLIAAVSPNPPAPLPRLIEILGGFGPDAIGAAEYLAIDGPNAWTYGAMRVLFGLDPSCAMPVFVANLYSADSGESMKVLATSGLKRVYGAVPERETAAAMLAEGLREANRRALGFTQDESPVVRWSYDESASSLRREMVPARIAEAGRAAGAAKMLAMLGPNEPSVEVSVIAATLRHAVVEDPLVDVDALGNKVSEVLQGRQPSEEVVSRVLSEAMGEALASDGRVFDEGAAVGACRWLGKFGSLDCLADFRGEKSALCKAVRGATPRLRYEASVAIGSLNPTKPYAGSAEVLQSWFDMGKLEDQGRAILLENNIDLGIALSQRLELMGLSVTRVSKGSELLAEIDRGGDLQAVVMTTHPPDFSAVELIDRIRRLPLGSVVPMVVIGPQRPGLDQLPSRWKYPVGIIQWDEGEGAAIGGLTNRVQELLETMRSKLTLPALSGVERRWFLEDSIRILGQLAENPDLDMIYHWREFGTDVIGAVERAGYTPEGLRVLSALGSPDAQGVLVSVVLDDSIDAELRSQASAAIVGSIQRFGTRLSRNQVVDLYDRYEMATEDADREGIVAVLEAIEKRAGVTTTSR